MQNMKLMYHFIYVRTIWYCQQKSFAFLHINCTLFKNDEYVRASKLYTHLCSITRFLPTYAHTKIPKLEKFITLRTYI